MDSHLIRLVSRAVRAGSELTTRRGQLLVRHADPDTLNQLRTHRDTITALLAGPCAGCGQEPWIHEHGTGIPWCRPCAGHRGRQLLRAEHPELLETNTCNA